MRAVHADRMHLVEIGQRIVLVGQVADRMDRRDITIHRIDALERDQLGHVRVFGGEQLFEMLDIIVAEDALLAARIADASDHRGVVELVRKDDAARQDARQRRERRVVRDIARGEQQCAVLAVQAGQLLLELDMIMRVAADIARAARACADIVQRLFHRGDHLGMLAHREIIVRAPDGDRLRAIVTMEAPRVGISALVAQDVDKDPVTAFGVQPVNRRFENLVVVHAATLVLTYDVASRCAQPFTRPSACASAAVFIATKSRNSSDNGSQLMGQNVLYRSPVKHSLGRCANGKSASA